jgi:radical SAM protein with 4Fe4S-binding SPASM domain
VVDAGPQFDRFHRGLRRLLDAGISVTLKAMAMRATVDEMLSIRDYARSLGLRFRYDAVISPRIDGGRKPLEQRLSPAEVARIENLDADRGTDYADYCHAGIGKPPADDRRYQCGAGLNSFVIDPYGKLHLCNLSRRPGWDVVKDGFLAGIRTTFPSLRAEKRSDTSGCGTCATHGVCSNCTGMAELEALSPDEGNPYFCQVSDARGELHAGAQRPTPNGLIKLRLRGENGQSAERKHA